MIAALGTFKYGIVPGIKTIDRVADDVHRKHLSIETRDRVLGENQLDVCFINSKGFGGNNATGLVISPRLAEKMLKKRHGEAAFAAYDARRQQTRANAEEYDRRALMGELDIIYNFGNDLIDEQLIEIDSDGIQVPGFAQTLRYKKDERFADMLD
ncbi:Beta-ketoacyl-[acyl-carrier-protein] synthase FabY [compost metagenome]